MTDDFIGKMPSLFPAVPEEAELLYSQMNGERDRLLGCIGHLRGDFGPVLHTTWWPHSWDAEKNNCDFKADLQQVVDRLKEGPLRDLETMQAFCRQHPESVIPNESEQPYGFRLETEHYRYMLRCTPLKGWYNVYLYCYAKEVMDGNGLPSDVAGINKEAGNDG